MKYIVTTTAKKKNAKCHIWARFDSLESARNNADKMLNKQLYIIEIFTGNWQKVGGCSRKEGTL